MSLITGHRAAVACAGAVLLGGLLLAGCGTGHAVKKISHPAASNRAVAGHRTVASTAVAGHRTVASTAVAGYRGTIDAFIAKLQGSAARPFEAKYMSFGKVPAEIVYAVRPPGGLLFQETALGRKVRKTQIVVNGSGEYLCKSSGHTQWACQQLGQASAAAQNKIFDVYTAAHWAAYLKTVTLAAGSKVTTSTAPANMYPMIGERARDDGMNCIGVRPAGAAAGFAGIRTICAGAPGILGSVLGCASPIIMMHWYTTSPSASLFQLPPGATVTRLKAGQT